MAQTESRGLAMQWMMVAIVLGQPVKTDLLYPTLDTCLNEASIVQQLQAEQYAWAVEWAAQTGGEPAAAELRVFDYACVPHEATR